MKTPSLRARFLRSVGLGVFAATHLASASVISPVQTTADPQKIKVVAPVQMAGSDAAAATFMQVLPSIQTTIQNTLPEYRALSSASLASMALDPNALRLGADTSVRAYFISEGAAWHNTLGFNTFAPGSAVPSATTPGIAADAQLIFPDVSSSDPTILNSGGKSIRTPSEPLLAGDFVDLGTFKAGTLLDFFLISNAVNGGTAVLTDESARNADQLQHLVTFTPAGTNYKILSYEDTPGGGDKDYNDVIVALQFTTLAAVAPEPKTWAGLALFGLFVGVQSLRKRAPKLGIS